MTPEERAQQALDQWEKTYLFGTLKGLLGDDTPELTDIIAAAIREAVEEEQERAAGILDEAEQQYWVAAEACHDQDAIPHLRSMEAECCRLAAAIRRGDGNLTTRLTDRETDDGH